MRSLATLATTLLLLIAAGPAFAHAHLVSSLPVANSTVRAAPKQLWLKFTITIRPTVSGVRLTWPDGHRTMLTPLKWDPRDMEAVTVPLPAKLPAGRYLVEWSALDPNAHRTHGSFVFTIAR
jgi:hypothetical protein